jgi:hypothetical protein
MRSDDGSSLVPSAAQGRACRNAPECGAAAAIGLFLFLILMPDYNPPDFVSVSDFVSDAG